MINNLINSKFFAGLTATVAFTGVMTNASIANAALIGEFQFAGLGVAEFTKDYLNFNPNPSVLFVSPLAATGSFQQFTGITTTIHGPVEFDPFSAPVPFIDFGGGNEFDLQQASIGEIIQSGDNASLDIHLFGTFLSADGDQNKGAGNITLQFNDTLASTIEQQLDAGNTLTAQFSGAVFSTTASTPEPTALFGLGVVTTGLVASRKRNKDSKAKI
ncbi:MAG: PEP-CTERM sorting domain-containing protein [Okeania sp. SIO3B5]|uniref:PEP-CTERM sorting domain-containing protein n=1 Tax=Okeania sp. SIO3B5 TaxID=2607811 RepID=UPI0014003730|nr:PEP-CTERM sorting domain-containing protein [Okeania sp. SIO3B5]NEO52773.1 PEP-CTERM sorting domain-containing protein [Okeania sp. SIO3B5]